MMKGLGYIISFLIIVIDCLSKNWALSSLVPYEPYPIFSMLNLTLAFNTGSAFSFLANTGVWHIWFFVILSLTMSAAIAIWMFWLDLNKNCLEFYALSLILGGALGNLWDRFRLGHVVDFIDFYYKNHHWPVFNFADSMICLGGGLLLIDIFKKYKRSM